MKTVNGPIDGRALSDDSFQDLYLGYSSPSFNAYNVAQFF